MAKKESTFLLLSLKDAEAKRLGQVISSETARKILDALAERRYTETELAEQLHIPLSTVHYNIQALVDAKLVVADEYHYSEKGREVIHYGLANKYVIIAPATTIPGALNKLKALLPVAVLVAAVGWAIQWFGPIQAGAPVITGVTLEQAVPSAAPLAADSAPAMMQAAPTAVQAIPVMKTAAAIPEPITQIPIGVWFALGAAFALTLYLLFEALWKRWK